MVKEDDSQKAIAMLVYLVEAPGLPLAIRLGAIEGLGRAGGSAALAKLLLLVGTGGMPVELRAAAARAIGEAVRSH